MNQLKVYIASDSDASPAGLVGAQDSFFAKASKLRDFFDSRDSRSEPRDPSNRISIEQSVSHPTGHAVDQAFSWSGAYSMIDFCVNLCKRLEALASPIKRVSLDGN